MCLLFFGQQLLESQELLLHVSIDFEVAGHNSFHSVDVIVDISLIATDSLKAGNEFSFLSQELGSFFEVL